MRKFVSRLNLGLGGQLAVIAAIFFFSFVTFNVLFQASSGDDYFKEIIAALIGTVLAAVITTMLLRSQSQGEELKERNVEVFRKKVEAYEQFLDQVLKDMEDSELSAEEARNLRRSVHKLSLFSSEDTVSTVSSFVRAQYVGDGSECSLSEVISAFRKDLSLEHVEELASYDLEAVDTVLRRGGDKASILAGQKAFQTFKSSLMERLCTDPNAAFFEAIESDETVPVGNGISFDLYLGRLKYGISIDYPEDPVQPFVIDGYLDAQDHPPRIATRLISLASALGFLVEDPSDPEELPAFHMMSDGTAVPSDPDQPVWTVADFVAAAMKLEDLARTLKAPLLKKDS